MKIAIWALIVLQVLGTLASVAVIDKPRKPISRQDVIISIISNIFIIGLFVMILKEL